MDKEFVFVLLNVDYKTDRRHSPQRICRSAENLLNFIEENRNNYLLYRGEITYKLVKTSGHCIRNLEEFQGITNKDDIIKELNDTNHHEGWALWVQSRCEDLTREWVFNVQKRNLYD